ncbi:P-loop containing nucleoside triphosphate hydrolase protein [Hypoxylon sp. FL1857]|nr:P-loop containing nucleoside triphosphate hydrolase protein [Hypoxylon sp. FL1857]
MDIVGASEASEQRDVSEFVSELYQHNCSGYCEPRWSEFSNIHAEIADLKTRNLRAPIIHRYSRCQMGWATHSITIQDPAMRRVLKYVLEDYQDIDLELAEWTFNPPFKPLVHRWDALRDFEGQADGEDRAASSTLIAFLTPIIAPSLTMIAKLRETNKIEFENIWCIFPPGTLVATQFYGVDTVCRVLKGEYIRGAFTFDVEFVDWNGEESGYRTTSLRIWVFGGLRRVNSLPVFPISYHVEEANTTAALIERGRKFEKLRGCRLMACNAAMLTPEAKEKKRLRPLIRDTSFVADQAQQADPRGHTEFSMSLDVDPTAKHPAERDENLCEHTEEELLMTTPWVHGFDFKTKKWGLFCVDDLEDVTWNDQAFDKLVLPNNEKEMALAFVEGKRRSKKYNFDDFIQNKGRGMIVLMFGPPGVGKTFTAEAVADKSRVALYAVSAGDLGTKPNEVEKALGRALELCSMWDAILLLDEADVFLGARTSASPERNEFVSIFLRMLEYYSGTLFLTTNRVESIDYAFQSRIDLFLPYNDLSQEARRRVWEAFIERLEEDKETLNITDNDLDRLSELKLNGREIKNIVKSAHLLWLGTNNDNVSPSDHLYMLARNRIQALHPLST